MAVAINQTANPHLDALFQIGSVRRDQAINCFIKIMTKIIENPQEDKYKDLNYKSIEKKFKQWNCNELIIELLMEAGFEKEIDPKRVEEDKKQRLKLGDDVSKCQQVLDQLYIKQKLEEEKLAIERQKIIEANKKRLNSKANMKKKQLKDKILAQHNEQMKLAKQGIYNVGASVSDKKATGNGVNTLSY